MKFYNRQQEIKLLEDLYLQADHKGVMTVLMGRRRVGKTALALHYVKGKKFLYLFVGRKEEHLLCQEFLEEIQQHFQLPLIGEINKFASIFQLLLEIAKKEKFVLILDEFQEFFRINPAIYSDIQKLWDIHKFSIKLHVMFIGSVHSLMHKIFENQKQPLFGRADRIIQIAPFHLDTLVTILKDNHIFNVENFFNFFVITGNLPKYLDYLLDNQAKNLTDILNLMFQKDSLFLNEGKNVLIEEFGRDYLTYFTILELISLGKTARGEIESILQKDIGGYLLRLEENYALIRRHRPIGAKPHSRNQKYKIIDNFLHFWFRFIYRNRTAIEMENFSYAKKLVLRDYATYSGPMLEQFFQKLLAEMGEFNQIGSYWEKGNQNEIDIVAINDMDKRILFVETKLNKTKINLNYLMLRAEVVLKDYRDYSPLFLALGVEDVLKLEQLLIWK